MFHVGYKALETDGLLLDAEFEQFQAEALRPIIIPGILVSAETNHGLF